MRISGLVGFGMAVLLLGSACASGGSSPLRFTHGQKVPDQFITIDAFTAESITFRIQVQFNQRQLFHILLDEQQNRLAESWIRTVRVGTNAYTAQLKLKPGAALQPGIRYRLCIGEESPDLVARHYSSYKCLADYEFILPEK